MGYQLPRIFSKMGSREAAAAGLAALTFAMAGCGGSRLPINPAVYDAMHDKPVSSYTLVPVMKQQDDKPVPTGRLDIVTKVNEIENKHAVSAEGKPGTMKCSTLAVVPARLNKMGQLEVSYDGGIGRCYSYSSSTITPMGSLLTIPAENNTRGCGSRNEQLVQRTVNICKFTPAAAASTPAG